MKLVTEVGEMVRGALSEFPGLFYVGVNADERNRHYRFIVDGDEPVSIADLSSISRRVSEKVDETLDTEQAFTFEISSPGADSPLILPRQYPKHVGRRFEIDLNSGGHIKGKLKEAGVDGILVESEQGKKQPARTMEVQYSEIKESKIIISFK